MRVCHVVPAYPDDVRGHREGQNYRALLQRLSGAGTPCTAVAPRQYSDSPLEAVEAGVEIRRFAFGAHDARLGELRLTPLRAFRFRRAGIRAIAAVHAATPCALIHAHTPVPCGLVALAAGVRLKLPVLLTLHGSDILVYPEGSAAVRRATAWVLRRVDATLAVAEHLADAARALVPEAEIMVLPIGYDDTVYFSGVAAEAREPVVISTRNLAPLYSVETLVQAAGELGVQSGVRVEVYGDGPERPRLEALAAGGPVRFHGFAPPATLAAALRNAAVYVSTARSDGTSVSLLEAMACGAYPVMTDIPANRRWIEDGLNGRLIPVGDVGQLAAAVRDALSDTAGRARAATLNAARVAEAAWSAVIPRLQDTYAAVLGGGSGHATCAS